MTDLPGGRRDADAQVGAIVIGRNEGERLRLCLQSVKRELKCVVYVDSGSSDGSAHLARSLDVPVVELDPREPFTAARARNAGMAELQRRYPDLQFAQFLDGDCELESGWIAAGLSFLQANANVAVVCGRRRERNPDASVFNRLCDMEWDTPVGDALSCGGDALFRVGTFNEAGGFVPTMIAGEEPDLCFRLRQRGWRVVRLNELMTTHDAAMFHPRQWWQRAKRSGYADMEANVRRGRFERQLKRRVWSNLLWSLPLAWPFWPLLWMRCSKKRGPLFATHIVLGKVPHAVGQLEFWLRARSRSQAQLIEYK